MQADSRPPAGAFFPPCSEETGLPKKKYVIYHQTNLMCLILYRGDDLEFATRLLNLGYSMSFL